jgi:hypothetical protein
MDVFIFFRICDTQAIYPHSIAYFLEDCPTGGLLIVLTSTQFSIVNVKHVHALGEESENICCS